MIAFIDIVQEIREATRMVVYRDARRFELTVIYEEDVWVARLNEWVPGRLWPTRHVLRAFAAHQQAIDALVRKWHILFPDEPELVWRDTTLQQTSQASRRRRRSTPKDT
jgi:hypothetical protein